MYGYLLPPIDFSAVQDAHDFALIRRRVVYEPHPIYFSALQKLGELLAAQPPNTYAQIAQQMNEMGYRYYGRQLGKELPWNPKKLFGKW